MVSLQGLHSDKAFRLPSISASVGLNSSCPWCLKLGINTETIAIHLREVHYGMAIVCDICQVFPGMTAKYVLDHQSRCKGNHNKEHTEHDAHAGHGKGQKSQN